MFLVHFIRFFVLFIFLFLLWNILTYSRQSESNTIIGFIKNNPDKSAILAIRNDSVIASLNINSLMPLASTLKIVIAIEYAEQSASGLIDADEMISLSELSKYFVPFTDGNAHSTWIQSVRPKIQNEQISIREIAKGMIKYSSNANTDWLLEKLGIENVNARIYALGLENHTMIFPLVSALFVGKELFPALNGDELKEKLISLDSGEYIETVLSIHKEISSSTTYEKDISHLSMDIQRIWSDNLPASTVKEYVGIMKKINNRNYFSSEVHEYLDEVMEYILENPANREWLVHTGMKGGSTPFVITKAMYATDIQGNKTELAYFFNNLSMLEMMQLQMKMNDFELNLLTKDEFRVMLKEELTK